MASPGATAATIVLGMAAAAGLLVAAPVAQAGPGSAPTAPCYNGITPMNPYVDNCGIPNRPPRVLGSAPDQTAILNCSVGGSAWRALCLSQFVNGGPFPGIAIGVR
ncbi:MAG: hypothetical protein ACR2JI_09670 [Mycobacterium sp.]